MKLKTKISLLMSIMVFVSICVVGVIYGLESANMVEKQALTGLSTSAQLASADLSGEIGSYEDMIRASASDYVLTHSDSGKEMFERISQLAKAYNFTSGNVLDLNGVSYNDGTDFSDREYVKKALAGEVNVSDVTLSKLTGKYGMSVASPLYNTDGDIKGVIYFRMDIDFMLETIASIKVSENSYAYIIDAEGNIIVHENQDMIGQVNMAETYPEMKKAVTDLADGKAGLLSYEVDGKLMECAYDSIENTNGWGLLVVEPRTDYSASLDRTIIILTVLQVVIFIIVMIIAINFSSYILKRVNNSVDAVERLSVGDFSKSINKAKGKDELAVLQNATYTLQNTFTEIIREEKRVLGAIVNYDLSQPDMKHYDGEYDELARSVNTIRHMLAELIAQVQEASSQVGIGSKEIANATENLSLGTLTQANSIQQVADDIRNINERIQKNSENEETVKEKLNNLENLINRGNKEMTDLVEVVKSVNEMSADIQKIVGTIESIAFQTNILALNAEVEAARAGDNGKGFAVVADEVGNLAARTTEASQQTAQLISRCIEGIEKAMKNADSTFKCLGEIVADASDIAEAFDSIADDTKQQAEKSENIKLELGNISDVVQTSTATAQETAAATEELSGQAQSMRELIQKFRL